MTKQVEKHMEESYWKRKAFWEGVGQVDADVLGPQMNPAFKGETLWPSLRQTYIAVRRPSSTIIATDGLSDPYDDLDEGDAANSYNGFGFEFYVQSAGKLSEVQNSWQFDLVYQAGQFAADFGNLRSALEQFGYLTTEVYNVRVPKEFQSAEGRTGVFIGLRDETIPSQTALSLETIQIVNLKLLTVKELEYAEAQGKPGRQKLAELFVKQGNPSYSDLKRKSVV